MSKQIGDRLMITSWNKETGVMFLSLIDLEHCGFDVDEIPSMLAMQGYSDEEIEDMKYPRIIIADLGTWHINSKGQLTPDNMEDFIDDLNN